MQHVYNDISLNMSEILLTWCKTTISHSFANWLTFMYLAEEFCIWININVTNIPVSCRINWPEVTNISHLQYIDIFIFKLLQGMHHGHHLIVTNIYYAVFIPLSHIAVGIYQAPLCPSLHQTFVVNDITWVIVVRF